ncbi:MAG: hypothetical protein A3H98_08270 [Bacteroidetes bacterium RIFCSPLOWO2_02_FULL_36_8]|nr:MAG: hypothetical protein A3H98_08270 [Bacteroidetes bacterium RIFCSPLOWO2_02_FULL_36_8]OFY68893.1 MAG: hypothetical protein A3G23_03685 [Bacteroidetes bacterium RIFCSPLOWO2_12_FULL_37_12]
MLTTRKFQFCLLLVGIILVLFTTIPGCDKNKKTTVINPNGDSELALLMREMTDYMVLQKINVAGGKEPGKYPLHFSAIHAAQPTDPEVRDDVFTGFADHFINKLKEFNGATPENRQDAYKQLVQSCAGCHQQICPGPLAKINKLY